MISGGGTGGGVYPALAVAAALSEEHTLLWLGSRYGIERELIVREGIPFEALPGGPLVGAGLRALPHAWGVLWAVLIAHRLVRRFRPDVLLITGGWPTVAPSLACWLNRVPIIIYLPDLEPSGAIRVLSHLAARVAVSAPQAVNAFRPGLAVETGYPLRAELLQAASPEGRQQARQRFELLAKLPTVLVFGGSQGARSINLALLDHLPVLLERCQVLHISGKLDWATVLRRAEELPARLRQRYHPFEYLHSRDMALALAAADLAVARAGASTIGEFPLFGLPAILVPYPYAWRYQKTNADYLVSHGAALRLDDEQLKEELGPLVLHLLEDATEREQMARASRALARPGAAQHIASLVIELARESRGKT